MTDEALCPLCAGLHGNHSLECPNSPLRGIGAPQPLLRPVAIISLIDGSSYNAVLNEMTWEQFMYELLTKGCVMTQDIFINRASIAHIRRGFVPADAVTPEGSNVVSFPPTKGSA